MWPAASQGLLAFLLAFLSTVHAADAVPTGAPAAFDIFVSPVGSDSAGDGSSFHPYASLGRAQAAVRSLLLRQQQTGGAADNITVHVAGGRYELTEPLVFDARDHHRQVRSYFLVFVPTIREIRDFYRDM
eukprot:SAG31_NODE_601_length_13643_cov_64.237005_15_plen_130_part_00